MSHPHHAHTDPRDHLISAEEVNATPHYVMYSVFRTAGPLRDPDATAAEKAVFDSRGEHSRLVRHRWFPRRRRPDAVDPGR